MTEPRESQQRPNGSVLYGTTPHKCGQDLSPTSRGTVSLQESKLQGAQVLTDRRFNTSLPHNRNPMHPH